MYHARDGVFFERQQTDGGVRILIKACGRDDAAVLKDIVLDKNTWASVIASMSYYGEDDYGFYRATNFHSKAPIDATSPIKDKPAMWPN